MDNALLQRTIPPAVGHKYWLNPGDIIISAEHLIQTDGQLLNYNKDNADTTNNPIPNSNADTTSNPVPNSNLGDDVYTPANLAYDPHRGSLCRSQGTVHILLHSHAQRYLLQLREIKQVPRGVP